MIVTLTLNPSLDRTVEVPALARGSVIRSLGGRLDPGGKGVNVARALLANGIETCAVLPVGDVAGHDLVTLLKDEGVPMTAVAVAGATRSNITISEPDGTVTKINESGEELSPREIDELAETVLAIARPDDWVVASGSLPAGVSVDVYAALVERFAVAGLRVAIDTSGPALGRAVDAGPGLIKPNREELAEVAGTGIHTIADAVAAARTLRERGAGAVLVSLGRDGALLVDGAGVVLGECDVVEPRSSIGAGDCLLAGFLASAPAGEAALANAVRWAAAAVELPGSGVPQPAAIARRRARISHDVEGARVLSPSG